MEIHAIATQGLHASEQFVTEYSLQYSDDGQAWRNIISSVGETEVLIFFKIPCMPC